MSDSTFDKNTTNEKKNENIQNTFLYQIFRIIIFNSDICLIIALTMFSLINNFLFKFVIYICILIIIYVFRIIISNFFYKERREIDKDVDSLNNSYDCTSILYPNSSTFTIFLYSFTLFYIISPVIIMSKGGKYENYINYNLILFFVIYICLDIFIKKFVLKCISFKFIDILINILVGSALGFLISFAMYSFNLKNILFTTNVISNNTVCLRPTNQKFKCSVYKNGMLVSNSVQ